MVESPVWLLALALPIWRAVRARRRPAADAWSVAAAELLVPGRSTWRMRLRGVPGLCRAASLGALATALASPSCEARESTRRRSGVDVYFLIDVSLSMRAQDAAPDRLGAAKAIAAEIVRARPDDRFGIILFAGANALACPLTTDHRAVLERLERIEPVETLGTAIGPAMMSGLVRFERSGVRNGWIILLSDGGSNAGEPDAVEAAGIARAQGVHLITVGMGLSRLAPYPTDLGTFEVPLETGDALLRSVASTSGGRYVRGDVPAPAASVADALAGAAPPERADTRIVRADLTGVIAMVAVFALAVELLVTTFVVKRWQ